MDGHTKVVATNYDGSTVDMYAFPQFGAYLGVDTDSASGTRYLAFAAMNADGTMDESIGEVAVTGDTPDESRVFLAAVNGFFKPDVPFVESDFPGR